MVKLTAYGGVSEIGGNKILLEDGDTRIFLDFGLSFTAEAKYLGGAISPRGVNGIGDYLEFGLLPRLEGLYAESQIKQTGIPFKSAQYQGVLISHAHVDHVGYLKFLEESVPVFCGQTSKTILGALYDCSGTDVNPSSFRAFRTGDKIRIDNIEIWPIHVDHSIPGAYGFIIHTTEGAIIYTGDLRLHGPVGKMTEEFVAKAAEEHPTARICEVRELGKERHTNSIVKRK